MAYHITNRSDAATDILVFHLDLSTSVATNVAIHPAVVITSLAVGAAGVSFPWVADAELWFAQPDGSGGYLNVTHFVIDSLHGNQFRIVGNSTDGYTFLQS